MIEKTQRVLELGSDAAQAGPPSASHAPSTGVAQPRPARVDARLEHREQALERERAIRRQTERAATDRLQTVHGTPSRCRRPTSAPGLRSVSRTRARAAAQPGEAVGRMRERAGERGRSCTAAPLVELCRFDGAKAQARLSQLGHDLAQMAAPAHKERDAPLRLLRAARSAMISTTRCASASRLRPHEQRVTSTAASQARMLRRRCGVRPPRRARSSHARASPARSLVHPLDEAACERKLADSASGSASTTLPEPGMPRTSGTTPPRLRGSGRSTASDRRPRTACVRRRAVQPAVSRSEQLELALEVSWNSSISRCRM